MVPIGEISRKEQRGKMLLKSLELSKSLSVQQRYQAFLELQESLVNTYFAGLRSRHPGRSEEELLTIAKE